MWPATGRQSPSAPRATDAQMRRGGGDGALSTWNDQNAGRPIEMDVRGPACRGGGARAGLWHLCGAGGRPTDPLPDGGRPGEPGDPGAPGGVRRRADRATAAAGRPGNRARAPIPEALSMPARPGLGRGDRTRTCDPQSPRLGTCGKPRNQHEMLSTGPPVSTRRAFRPPVMRGRPQAQVAPAAWQRTPQADPSIGVDPNSRDVRPPDAPDGQRGHAAILVVMVTQPLRDPIEDEAARVFAENPGLQGELEAFGRAYDAGHIPATELVPHGEGRRRLGLLRTELGDEGVQGGEPGQ